jgi:hypothetical protein
LWRRIFDKIPYPRSYSIIAYVLNSTKFDEVCNHHNVVNANAFMIWDKQNKQYKIFIKRGHELLSLIHELVHVYNYELFDVGIDELEEKLGGM